MLMRTGPRGSFLLRGGVEWDLAANVSGDGLASGLNVDLSSDAGFVADVGLWYQSSNRGGMTATLRFTRLSDSAPGGSIDATSGALMLGLVLDPR
jgi:hypothetical protein